MFATDPIPAQEAVPSTPPVSNDTLPTNVPAVTPATEAKTGAAAPSALPPLGPNLTEDIEPAELTFEHFELIIYNQVGVVFNEKVKALASANSVGPFSVLPGHTNFISMITAPVTAYLLNGQTRTFEAGLGVLRCFHNRVEVFAGLHVSKEAEELAKRLQGSGQQMVQGEEITAPVAVAAGSQVESNTAAAQPLAPTPPETPRTPPVQPTNP